jgi:hypothetical protein
VPKLGIRDTWQNHKVGLGNRQADTRHLLEGVNTPLTSHVSRIHEIRAQEFDIETREVVSCEKCEREVNLR